MGAVPVAVAMDCRPAVPWGVPGGQMVEGADRGAVAAYQLLERLEGDPEAVREDLAASTEAEAEAEAVALFPTEEVEAVMEVSILVHLPSTLLVDPVVVDLGTPVVLVGLRSAAKTQHPAVQVVAVVAV